mmetsp:Transcript_27804/g.55678  ORF Transcript_27804/g.55678 Transcript_27804/m.55678 type:complete len:200 (-) Transcript_27804:687-1286(-)
MYGRIGCPRSTVDWMPETDPWPFPFCSRTVAPSITPRIGGGRSSRRTTTVSADRERRWEGACPCLREGTRACATRETASSPKFSVRWCTSGSGYFFFFGRLRRTVPLRRHVVDPRKPVTTIALRLPSQRERIEFNTDHTVQDLRRCCRLELGSSVEFELMAGFPPKAVPDDHSSLEKAGLLNAAVDVQAVSTAEDKRRL